MIINGSTVKCGGKISTWGADAISKSNLYVEDLRIVGPGKQHTPTDTCTSETKL